jgi:hypothetical protein
MMRWLAGEVLVVGAFLGMSEGVSTLSAGKKGRRGIKGQERKNKQKLAA